MSWPHISAGGFLKGMSAVMAGICTLGLTACGQQQGESIWEYEREPAGESVTEEAVWQKAGFAAPGKPKEQQTLWAVQFQPWKHNSRVSVDEEKELIYLDSGVCGELFWYLGTESGAELCPEKEYVLDLYDTVSGENAVKSFTPLELGLDSPMVLLCGMDMLDREHYVLRWTEYEQDEEGMCHQIVDGMIYTDLSGNSQTTDLREVYLEKGITREESAEAPTLQSINWHCDGRGNIYVIDQKEDGSGGLYLFDPNGQSQMEYGLFVFCQAKYRELSLTQRQHGPVIHVYPCRLKIKYLLLRAAFAIPFYDALPIHLTPPVQGAGGGMCPAGFHGDTGF